MTPEPDATESARLLHDVELYELSLVSRPANPYTTIRILRDGNE